MLWSITALVKGFLVWQVLAVFDVNVPPGMTPINGDGEVEEFTLMTIEEALDSVRCLLDQNAFLNPSLNPIPYTLNPKP